MTTKELIQLWEKGVVLTDMLEYLIAAQTCARLGITIGRVARDEQGALIYEPRH